MYLAFSRRSLRFILPYLASLFVLACLLAMAQTVQASGNTPQTTTRYVATTGNDTSNNCDNSATPCYTIQRAVDVASAGDEVRVAGAFYYPVLITTVSVTLVGGFSTSDWNTPDFATNLTIIDGTLGGNMTRPLAIMSAAANGTVIQGFTIQKGDATSAAGTVALGGGLYISGTSNVQLLDLIVTDNVASTGATGGAGGGIAALYANKLHLERVVIKNNRASSAPQASGFGGGIYIGQSDDLRMTQITVTGNLAGEMWPSEGGGIYHNGGKNPKISQAYVAKNRAGKLDDGSSSGGGIAIFNTGTSMFDAATIERSQIIENVAARGGGVAALATNVEFLTTVIARNSAKRAGAALFSGFGEGGTLWLTNSTLADNNLAGAPEIVYVTGTFTDSKRLVIYVNGSILGGNPTGFSTNATVTPIVSAPAMLQNSDVITIVQPGITLSGQPVVKLPVSYVDPAHGNYHLPAASSAIDLLPFVLPPAPLDLDGNLRELDKNCNASHRCGSGKLQDFGAYEYQYSAPTLRYVATTGINEFNNCLNPIRPCRDLSNASKVTQGGDEIRVASGLYNTGDACLTAILCIREPMTVTGGFTTANWNTPATDASLSILDGANKLRGVDVVYDFAQGSGLLQNFTIQNGVAPSAQGGGGMDIEQPSQNFTVRNLHFKNNKSDNDGGGLRGFKVENFLLQNSIFSGNVITDGRGGGVAMVSDDPAQISYTLEGLTVFNNQAKRFDAQSTNGGRGGGIFLEGDGVLRQSEIYSNTADHVGGGVASGSNFAHPILEQVIIHDNSAPAGGGYAIFLTGGATLRNTLISHNHATSANGVADGMTQIIAKGGNGLYSPAAGAENLHLFNVTIVDNTGSVPSAVQVDGKDNGQPTAFNRLNEFVNVLISGSQQGIASDGAGQVKLQKVLIASDVTTPLSGLTAGQNLTGTSLSGAADYVGGGDYHLTSGSAARDAGDTAAGLTVDLDGVARPQGSGFDIGAYELVPTKLNQTINFELLPSKVITATPFSVAATATSGLAVSFSSTTPAICTVSGNIVTLLAKGSCTLRAQQAGNGQYNPATAVERSFTIVPAGTVPPPSGSKLYLPLVRR